MAQNTWINVTLDTSAVDTAKLKHIVSGHTAAANDATFSFDSAKMTTLNQFDTVIAAIRLRILGAGFK